MAKAKKLPSGSWRVLAYAGKEDGKPKYKSFTAPTKKEAEFIVAQWVLERKESKAGNITVKEAVDRYITAKEGTLAPSTYREYKKSAERDFKSLHKVRIDDLTSEIFQRTITEELKTHSAKSVRNMAGLFLASVQLICPDIRLRVELPKINRREVRLPTEAEVQKLLLHVKGQPMEGAIMLAATGSLRRSEVATLTLEDVTDTGVKVTKAMVLNADREWVLKPPKTRAGYRTTALPAQVIEVVRRCIPFPNPNGITKGFEKACQECGIEGITFHRLRHYYASVLHYLGIPDQNIMASGGWSSPQILQGTYEHTLLEKEQEIQASYVNHFATMVSGAIQHEIQHKKKTG